MKINEDPIAELEVGRWGVPMLLQAIVASLCGLGYVIVFPFAGLFSFISLGGSLTKQGLSALAIKK